MRIFNLILLLFLLDFGLGCEVCSHEAPGDCDFSEGCDGWKYSNASVTSTCNISPINLSNDTELVNNDTEKCLELQINQTIQSHLACVNGTPIDHCLSFDYDFSQGAVMTLTVEIFSHDPRCQYNGIQISYKVLDSRNSSGWTPFEMPVYPNNNFTVNILAQGIAGKVLIANIRYARFRCVLPTTEEHVSETTDYRTNIATTDKPSTSTTSLGIVIGASVAVVVCVALCTIILVICKRKRRGRGRKHDNANEDQEPNPNPFQQPITTTASSRGELNNTTNQDNLHQELPSFYETVANQTTGYDYEEVNLNAAKPSGSNPTPGPNNEYSHLDMSGTKQHLYSVLRRF